eukprot:1495900-Rhodomonas_salina.1
MGSGNWYQFVYHQILTPVLIKLLLPGTRRIKYRPELVLQESLVLLLVAALLSICMELKLTAAVLYHCYNLVKHGNTDSVKKPPVSLQLGMGRRCCTHRTFTGSQLLLVLVLLVLLVVSQLSLSTISLAFEL